MCVCGGGGGGVKKGAEAALNSGAQLRLRSFITPILSIHIRPGHDVIKYVRSINTNINSMLAPRFRASLYSPIRILWGFLLMFKFGKHLHYTALYHTVFPKWTP